MFATLILGIAAGMLPKHAEPHLKPLLGNVLGAETPISPMELRIFSLVACLVLAALLSHVFGDGSALGLAIGAAIGVIWPRAFALIQGRRAPNYEDD